MQPQGVEWQIQAVDTKWRNTRHHTSDLFSVLWCVHVPVGMVSRFGMLRCHLDLLRLHSM